MLGTFPTGPTNARPIKEDQQNPITIHNINPWAGQDALQEALLAKWYATARWNEVLETPKPVVVQKKVPQASQSKGSGVCGGDLPPCSVMMCESGGSLTAQNPHSTASGKWQILDSTWNGFGGYRRAKDAPESVQDERARQIYSGGKGRGQWVC